MMRILLADDERSIRATLSGILRAEGYEVEMAQDADEAILHLGNGDFDVVVSDIVLPRVNGMELLETIRNIAPRSLVVMMTGEPTVETAARALRAGAFDYLLKPVGKDAILRVIGNASRVKSLEDERGRLEEENRQYREQLEEMVRKQTEALRESREKYVSILENVGIGITLLTPELRILEANKKIREWSPLADLSKEPLCYEALNAPPREDACPGCPCVETFRDGLHHESIIEKGHNSSTRSYRAISSPIRDTSGAVTAVIEMLEDITEKRKMEDQLRRAQKMEAVGQLAAGVAHDFNNVLQAMLGHASLAMRGLPVEHPCYSDLEEIRGAIDRAASLTRQLLIFSRRDVVETKDLDLNEVIKNVLKMLRRLIGEHIELDVVSNSHLGVIHADPGRMEQILMNLCVNARDAMPGGGVITVKTENVRIAEADRERFPWAREPHYVLLSVSDQGCGIPPELRERIFEPFFTTKEKGKGTGLGLATVHDIVAEHQGRIEIRGEVGKGTTFEIYLPSVHRNAVLREKMPAKLFAPGGRERILFAEDDDNVRKIGVRLLEQAGYNVFAVENGAEAIEVLDTQADAFDAAILDAVMPKKSGLEVFERIKALGKTLPVLLCSGHIQNAPAQGTLEDHGIELLRKPYSNEQLLGKLRQILDRSEEERKMAKSLSR